VIGLSAKRVVKKSTVRKAATSSHVVKKRVVKKSTARKRATNKRVVKKSAVRNSATNKRVAKNSAAEKNATNGGEAQKSAANEPMTKSTTNEPSTNGELLIASHRDGFRFGYTRIVSERDAAHAGVDFGIHVFRRGERLDQALAKECVWVLLQGEACVALDGEEHVIRRDTLFDEAPTALHVGPNTRVWMRAQSDRVEWAFVAVTNPRNFSPRLFVPHDLEPEYRGLGLAQGTCLRNVRLIFDRENRPESNLVVGEVINYPGRWSSYPPHHHAQPEIYHYRFNKPQGYGHGEVGEQVFKVHDFDTLRIPGMNDHAQVAAPGYAMYYLWIVRHLDDQPYEGFEFTSDHEWVLDAEARVWEPSDVPHASGEDDRPQALDGSGRRPWIRRLRGSGGADSEGSK
jgi:5-deoxy-glucuronate isomerase